MLTLYPYLLYSTWEKSKGTQIKGDTVDYGLATAVNFYRWRIKTPPTDRRRERSAPKTPRRG